MKLSYLPNGAQNYIDRSDSYLRFIVDKQLTDSALWTKFVEVYKTREDISDNGWRGEYYGKMMRGACLAYKCRPDDRLYDVLESTVRALLATADEMGRISTYPAEQEFRGWDMWCRKYVLVGSLYFYDICKDEAFKGEILSGLRRHLDYIAARIGEGKTAITDTSNWYGGMNAASLLEPVVEMYKLTKEPAYLTLAKHIIASGGCRDGSVPEAVMKGVLPHEFPTTKAYETMSYFEGILAYYELTGEQEYLDLVSKFYDLVAANEITLIGCAGCHGEHFDHAALTQANDVPDKTIMQETCVTVTWMRLSERLLRATGDMKYADRIEISALNALYGAINLFGEKQYCKEEKLFLDGVPFDSYSPLVPARRGVGIGGYKKFSSGGYYGCCACIGAAGVALYPLASAMKSEQGMAVLFYHEGEITLPALGGELRLAATGSLTSGKMTYVVSASPEKEIELAFRIPSWSRQTHLMLNGEAKACTESVVIFRRVWEKGDSLEITFDLRGKTHILNGKVAFTYGPFVLARDEYKEKNFSEKLYYSDPARFLPIPPEEGEEVRFLLHTEKGEVLLTDYASCGKHWTEKKSRIAVWQRFKA